MEAPTVIGKPTTKQEIKTSKKIRKLLDKLTNAEIEELEHFLPFFMAYRKGEYNI